MKIKEATKESNPYAAIFPRDQHPDKRSNQEFLRDLKFKQMQKKLHSGKWYPLKVGNRAKAVVCLTTKKEYVTVQDAAKDMKVPIIRMWRHLKGYELYSHINGNKFQYL